MKYFVLFLTASHVLWVMVSCLVGLSRPPWRMSACRGSFAFWVTCVCRHGRRQPIKTQDWIPSQVILKLDARTLTDMPLFFLTTDQCAQCKLIFPELEVGYHHFIMKNVSQPVPCLARPSQLAVHQSQCAPLSYFVVGSCKLHTISGGHGQH